MSIVQQRLFLEIQTPAGPHRMAWQEWSDNTRTQQPLLVCVHGLTRNSRDFDALAAVLAADFRVVCPDVLGRGDSDWLRQPLLYGYPLYLTQMQQWLAHLFSRDGQRGCCWVGTSMGGLIGMMLAAQPGSPIIRLVLNDIGAFIPYAALARLARYVGKAPLFNRVDEVEEYLRRIAAPFGPLTDEQWQHLARHGCEPAGQALRLRYDPAIAAGFAAVSGDVDLTAVWQQVQCPVLLVRGADSDIFPAAVAQQMLQRPGTRLVEFAGIGHAPMLMARDQQQAVGQFLRVRPAPASI